MLRLTSLRAPVSQVRPKCPLLPSDTPGQEIRTQSFPIPERVSVQAARFSARLYPAVSNHRRLGIVLCALALCAWCGWASGLHRSTALAVATWAISLAAVAGVNLLLWRGSHGRQPGWHLRPAGEPWPRPGQRGSRRVWVGVSPWLGLALIALTWDVLGIDTGSREPHLTISALAQAFRPMNAALLLVWMLAGVGYGVARARAPILSTPAGPGPSATARASWHGPPTGTHPPTIALGLLLPANRAIGVCFWLSLVVAGVAVDFIARHSGGRLANAEELIRFITSSVTGNVVLVAAWTFAGWHLFAY